MAPMKASRKRASDSMEPIEGLKVSTMQGTPQRSPIKKRKLGISLAQKQALIDNLQLEITERARRLRAQYNIQAQQLRSRVEMRINRIPTALRKAKMGELLLKSLQPPQSPSRPAKPAATVVMAAVAAPKPAVPAKDATSAKPVARKPVPISKVGAGRKRLSDEMSGADKENHSDLVENPKKRPRGVIAKDSASTQPAHVLSPASSNTRLVPRPTSPVKTMASRPASPMKAPGAKTSSNLITNMVEKAKATRPQPLTRKTTTAISSAASSTNGPAPTRSRQAATNPRPPTAASTRGRRKVSGTSESSEGSTTTVLKKTTASRAAKTTGPAAKKTVMGTIKSATTKKPPAPKAAAATAAATTTTGTGRTLRKRG
ncbi:Borealin N terminal-domain-containing protein [Hypoxylon fragiforme]|uniref:Borealin N terminal-domain-containing protein n=1 Tax=Hypoxylon fragiforme TaxID=63214 RepID=UPI0020C66FE0|nr:Borealin N terminal-domain-containing protein [Hypoxylon fragiforme]KAI2607640.1 Borealin N terminal-domain-containing protein [Hypoxylon fragiforme]